MALPIAPDQIIAVVKFAYDLWKSCRAAKGQFEQVGKEVYAMRTVIELVYLECQNPNSIINLADSKGKTIQQQLGVHIQNCEVALAQVDTLLKRYSRLDLMNKAAWALWRHSEVRDLESDLSSFATQLDSFVNGLTLKGVGMVNTSIFRLHLGIGRIEEALDNSEGNDETAIKNVMKDVRRSGISYEEAKKYEAIFHDYAEKTSRPTSVHKSNRKQTSNPSRKRDKESKFSEVQKPTEQSSPDDVNESSEKRPLSKSSNKQSQKHTLECWLIKSKSAAASIMSVQSSKKEKQVRGQRKLEEMTKQFRSASQASKLAKGDDLVKWVLKDKIRDEKDPKYTWKFHAAKVERNNTLCLGLGIEHQAMIIIKRQMTLAARRNDSSVGKIVAVKKTTNKKAEDGQEDGILDKKKKAMKEKQIEVIRSRREGGIKEKSVGKIKETQNRNIKKESEKIKIKEKNADKKAKQKTSDEDLKGQSGNKVEINISDKSTFELGKKGRKKENNGIDFKIKRPASLKDALAEEKNSIKEMGANK